MKYQQLGIGWNDKKYDELGTIVKDCNKALNDILQIMLQAEKYVASLAKSVQEYDNVNLDTPSARNQLSLCSDQKIYEYLILPADDAYGYVSIRLD